MWSIDNTSYDEIPNNDSNSSLSSEKKSLTDTTSKIIDSLALSIWNDNITLPKANATGNDNGKTFVLNWRVHSQINWNPYLTNTSLSHFTYGEIIPKSSDGKIDFSNIDSKNATRIDLLSIGVKREIAYILSPETTITTTFWAGIQAIGNFGWGIIQKEWHRVTNRYTNDAQYESVSWLTPDIRAGIWIRSYITGDWNKGIYIHGNTDINIPLNNFYGSSKVEIPVWLWINIWETDMNMWITHQHESAPIASETINGAYENGNNQEFMWVSIYIPISNTSASIFWEITKPTSNLPGNSGQKGEPTLNIGMQWKL